MKIESARAITARRRSEFSLYTWQRFSPVRSRKNAIYIVIDNVLFNETPGRIRQLLAGPSVIFCLSEGIRLENS